VQAALPRFFCACRPDAGPVSIRFDRHGGNCHHGIVCGGRPRYYSEMQRQRCATREAALSGGAMRLFLSLVFVLAAHSAYAQQWARARVDSSPRHREWITVKHGDRSVEAFVAYPESSEKRPVVLVIHTIAGMIDWVESLSDQLAEAGYIAVAPDLLSGMGPNGGRSNSFAGDGAREAVGKLNPDQITADLNAVADYAKKFPASNGKLMVVGFCWGGNESFRFATNRKDLAAAFVFYGTPPSPEALARIQAPVYGFYGGNDARVTSTVPAATENMKAAGKSYEPVTYDGAGHGFMQSGEDPAGPDANKKARTEAWERWKKLLAKHQ
jgi:carboxymethylenebutenolidase